MTNPQQQQSIWGAQDIRTVLADPPWEERGAGKIRRGADRHYPLLKTPEIPKVIQSCPHWSRLADSAHCYMWVTNNRLPDGLWVLEQIGFRYVTNLVWAKRQMGLGRYFRGKHELLLFGVRGNFIETEGTHTTLLGDDLLDHPRDENGTRIHSKKPEEAHALCERASPGGHLELFARQERPGWTVWGNEV